MILSTLFILALSLLGSVTDNIYEYRCNSYGGDKFSYDLLKWRILLVTVSIRDTILLASETDNHDRLIPCK